MFEFHADKESYFSFQKENAGKYVIPFIEEKFPLHPDHSVLEIGCAEGGVLAAFLDRGCRGVGVELSPSRAASARKFLEKKIEQQRVQIFDKDIYDPQFRALFLHQFDLIILKDVIEHIHDQKKLMGELKNYLKPAGKIFLGFPPWQMPFGGHQQVCRKKWLATLPYYHLLPETFYKGILEAGGETTSTIDLLLEVKETGISIERFERIVKEQEFRIDNKTFFFINPIYQYKFGWMPRKQSRLISSLPFIRNFFTTAVYYLIS